MRKVMAVSAIAALLVALAAVSASGSTTKTVKWHLPTHSTVKIPKGGTVKWRWTDGQEHSVVGPGFKSKESFKTGFTYSHIFKKKGTFKIQCGIHGPSMTTKVQVG